MLSRKCVYKSYIFNIYEKEYFALNNLQGLICHRIQPNQAKPKYARRYLTETIMDADYADDLALLTNIPTQVKSPLDSLEQAARGIGFYMNSDKTDFISLLKIDLVLVGFYGISTLVGYLMPNPFYTYILRIYIWFGFITYQSLQGI